MSFSSFSFPLFFSLFGFYTGNIFPTTFGFFQSFFPWSHSLGIAIILWNEFLGFLFFRCGFLKKERNGKTKLTFYLRCFQFGLLFGIFVDAFKVGS